MDKFNYGKYFYEHKIFDIGDLNEIDKMSQAIEDARIIEKYFFEIVPNIDKIKNVIAFSFKLNPYLNYIDRINYIRGIVYSQDYIDYNDVVEFYNLITNYDYVVDIPTIFNEKSFCEEKDSDFFNNLMIIDKLYGNNIFNDTIIDNNDYNITDKEKKEEEKVSPNIVPAVVEKVPEIINNINESSANNTILFEFNEDDTVDVTPRQKILNFKENFPRYVKMVLECKDIDENKNFCAYICVIIGMTDWFNFVIDIIETINGIAEGEKKCLRNKLSDFI